MSIRDCFSTVGLYEKTVVYAHTCSALLSSYMHPNPVQPRCTIHFVRPPDPPCGAVHSLHSQVDLSKGCITEHAVWEGSFLFYCSSGTSGTRAVEVGIVCTFVCGSPTVVSHHDDLAPPFPVAIPKKLSVENQFWNGSDLSWEVCANTNADV